MGSLQHSVLLLTLWMLASRVLSEDPYRFFTWTVTYGTIKPLGTPQQGILINGQFPGPPIEAVTNDNIIINVFNQLKEPFLLTWNGIQHRRNSWQDGVLGTNCPILPGQNFTYKFQVKDQIGTYSYFPSTVLHKAAGGFGALSIASRPLIPVPYPPPDGDYNLLIGDWYSSDHAVLKGMLDSGKFLGIPNGVHINGLGGYSRSVFKVEPGKSYRLRISNVGLSSSLNFRIEGHKMKLVETEGSHTAQNEYDSLDIHVGQSSTVLVKADQPPKDYYIVASTRFISKIISGVGFFSYSNSKTPASGPLPSGPPEDINWSLNQAKSIRWNLTASAARPNPQGSYRYGSINITRTITLASSVVLIDQKQRCAVNGISFKYPDTPLKLADYFNITGVFKLGTMPDSPKGGESSSETAVMSIDYRAFVEIIFQNDEDVIQSWHMDGYSFFVVGMGIGQWTPASRKDYNLFDAINRYTTQVYPKSWTAIVFGLDHAGMWNVRSQVWERQYLGQQFYIRIYGGTNPRDEYPPPQNALLCGQAAGRRIPPSRYRGHIIA